MTKNGLKVLEIIWLWGGEASIDTIAREARLSTDYTRLICEELGRDDYIDFRHSKLCVLRSKGKREAMKDRDEKPRRLVVQEKRSKFGLGKDKRGRLLIDY